MRNSFASDFKRRLEAIVESRDAHKLYEIALAEAFLHYGNGSGQILWILRHLGRIAEPRIVPPDDRQVQSASIFRSGSRFNIVFNGGFIIKYISTPLCLLHVILHELGHKIMGDLYRSMPDNLQETSFVRKLVNIVADMLLNAFIRRNLIRVPPPYHATLYKNGGLFATLLCPPEFLLEMESKELNRIQRDAMTATQLVPVMEKAVAGFIAANRRTQTVREQESKRIARTLADLYYDCWFADPSFDSALKILAQVMKDLLALAGLPIQWFVRFYDGELRWLTIGDHEFFDSKSPWLEWFRRQAHLREPFAKMAGFGARFEEAKTDEEIHMTACRELYEAVRKSITSDARNPVIQEQLLAEYSVVPMPARREAFFLMGGYIPLFYPNVIFRREWNEWRVNIYVDVSGSVERIIPVLFGLIAHLKEVIGEPVYAFSNKVTALNVKDIEDGRYRTTGGTDFNCVARHAMERNFRRILVITDGHAGFEPSLKEELLKKAEVFALLTADNRHSEIVEAAGGEDKEGSKWWVIPQNLLEN